MLRNIFIFTFIALFIASCDDKDYAAEKMNIPFNEDIKSIDIDGPFNVIVSNSDINEVQIEVSGFIYDNSSFGIDDKGGFYAKMNNIDPSYNYNNSNILLDIYIPAPYLSNIKLSDAAYCKYTPSETCGEDATYTITNTSRLDILSKAVFLKSLTFNMRNVGIVLVENKGSILVDEEFYFNAEDFANSILDGLTVNGKSSFNLYADSNLEVIGESKFNPKNTENFNELNMGGNARFVGSEFQFSNLKFNGTENAFAEVLIVTNLSAVAKDNTILKYKTHGNQSNVDIDAAGSTIVEEIE